MGAEINVGGLRHGRTVAALLARVRRPGTPLVAAEVGVYRGRMSAYLLANVPDLQLVMVDAWTAPPEDSDYWRTKDSCALLDQVGQDENKAIAFTETHPWYERRTVRIEASVEAAQQYADGHFDLVFIDAAHDYASVRQDIAAWWPKVREGGILSGHDYTARGYRNGVKRAVDEFCNEQGLAMELGNGKVWIVRKP